ncbi:MAG: Ig-like domain-containing protein, partial [Acidimicrobiia bacterium]|nr:Ig-like domain-containing protein [Acidimicrobiia bacterium]
TYTPNADFFGLDGFTYEVCDSGGLCDTAVVSITVTAVNDAPVAADDTASAQAAVAVVVDVVANDSDVDGNLVPGSVNTVCVGCVAPGNGTAVANGDGTFTYTADAGFEGVDTFVYEVCDSGGLCDTAVVSITVTVPNDPPVAGDDSVSTPEDVAVVVDVVANDSDVDGNLVPGSVNTGCVGCAAPTSGIAVANGDGTFTYTPNADFFGLDGFTYEVCDSGGLCDTAVVSITVTAVNDAPVAADDTALTFVDESVVIDVVANDSDADGNLVPGSVNTTCVGCAGPSSGTAVANVDGSFTYTPAPAYTGADQFTYEVCDSSALCDTANVNVDILNGLPATIEVRVADRFHDAEERSTGQVSVTSSDLELTEDRQGPQTVGVFFDNLTIPAGATVTDAWIQFQVDQASSGPVALTIRGQDSDTALPFANSSFDVSSRPVTTAQITWAPPDWNTAGEAGIDQRTPDLTAIIQEILDRPGWSDGNAMALTIVGTGVRIAEAFDGSPTGGPLLHVDYVAAPQPNRPPVATDDNAATVINTAVDIDVAANDTDPDGNLDPASVNTACGGCAPPVRGSVDVNNGGTVTYTPEAGFDGSDGFGYEICDTDGLCDTALVAVTVSGSLSQTIEVRVASSSDDAEELDTGQISLNSSDLELGVERRGAQTVGVRFVGLAIPDGAVIESAWIQFETDETGSDPASLVITGEAADNPATFVNTSGNLSGRATTAASVDWNPAGWLIVGEAGPNQRTPELAAVVQEIIDRPGWVEGNAMVFMVSGSGTRAAEAYNGSPTGAPLIHIEYRMP